jgi:hypothetical protein
MANESGFADVSKAQPNRPERSQPWLTTGIGVQCFFGGYAAVGLLERSGKLP